MTLMMVAWRTIVGTIWMSVPARVSGLAAFGAVLAGSSASAVLVAWLALFGTVAVHEAGHNVAIAIFDGDAGRLVKVPFGVAVVPSRAGRISGRRRVALAGPVVGLGACWALLSVASHPLAVCGVVAGAAVHLHSLSPTSADGRIIFGS